MYHWYRAQKCSVPPAKLPVRRSARGSGTVPWLGSKNFLTAKSTLLSGGWCLRFFGCKIYVYGLWLMPKIFLTVKFTLEVGKNKCQIWAGRGLGRILSQRRGGRLVGRADVGPWGSHATTSNQKHGTKTDSPQGQRHKATPPHGA